MSDLWNGIKIPIVMCSGPVNSGKTLLSLTIDPNTRRPATEIPPTTLIWDQEGSADSYVGGLNFEHKDMRAAVGAGIHLQVMQAGPTDPRWRKILLEHADVNDSPSMSMFRAWYLSLLNTPAGKHCVGICDTFTPLQDGLVDWLRRHPEAFGRSAAQYDKAASMFLWPDLKAVLSHILATDCRMRFDTFVMNVHLKNEWAGGAKTGKQVAEGLDVLEKLATLHLELDRTPTAKGKDAPRVPAAIVKKERLVRFGQTGDDDQPILPPRIAHCTPDEIRRYIAAPPDFAKLKPEERLPDQSMSDDEKKQLDASIAENNRATAEAHLSALEMARRAAEAGRIGVSPMAVPAAAPQIAPQVAGPKLATQQQLTEMVSLLRQLFATGVEAQQYLLGKGIESPSGQTESQMDGLLSEINGLLAAKQQAAIQTPTIEPQSTNNVATQEQRDRIRELTMAIYGEQAGAQQQAFLARFGYSAAMSLKSFDAQGRINELEAMAGGNDNGVSGTASPF